MKNAMEKVFPYTNIELDLQSGKRGERTHHVVDLINSLTGSESAVVVNNNAAAVFLMLNTLAEGKEVIISRGEQVEIGGSLKNIMAIAAGICDGIGYGDNSKAAILTRGMNEMTRLGVKMGANKPTFSGLSGIGDLLVTALSKHSRNRFVGEQIGLGKSVDEVTQSMDMVAEGINTCKAVPDLVRKYGVEMPISQSINDILFKKKNPLKVVKELMTRKLGPENS